MYFIVYTSDNMIIARSSDPLLPFFLKITQRNKGRIFSKPVHPLYLPKRAELASKILVR